MTHEVTSSLSQSAGVGRTGTFIVIDAMMDMIHAEQKVDVFEFVSRIRNQRPQMVQTDVSAANSNLGLNFAEHPGAFACDAQRRPSPRPSPTPWPSFNSLPSHRPAAHPE